MRSIARCFLILAGVSGFAAQQPSEQVDPKDLLLQVREKVLQTINQLPRYMCTETVDRVTFQPANKVANLSCDDLVSRKRKADADRVHKYTSDRLRLDVAVASDGEMYSWAGENRFQDKPLADLVDGGATSTGAYISFLRGIFEGTAASFTFDGESRDNGRALMKYGFQISQDKSHYTIGNAQVHAIVPYDGTFLVDPNTSDLVRLIVHADRLPAELYTCEDTTTLDSGAVRLNGSEFLLPTQVRLHVIGTNGTELDNRTVFSGCREFRGESSLSFSAIADSGTNSQQPGALAAALPPGLPFTLALTDSISISGSAAGDPIKAVLVKPLKTTHGRVLLAKGTIVNGRFLRVERTYGPKWETLKVALKFERVNVNGHAQPLHAKLESSIKKRDKMPLVHSGESLSVREDLGTFGEMLGSSQPGAGVLEFEDVTENYVIRPGIEMCGTTTRADDQ